MKLLDELRNVEPGNPGAWSRRVSLTLACALLAVVAGIGFQLRVRASLGPELASAEQALAGLEQQLAQARRAARRTQALRADIERLENELQRAGTALPRSAESLDLAVLLTANSDDSPVEEVRPWQATSQTPGLFPHVGAEMRIAGHYAEIVSAIGAALAAGELRELAEIRIESIDSGEEPATGRLQAAARLLAYHANESHALNLPAALPRKPAMAMALPTRADLPSPFAPPAAIPGVDAAETLANETAASLRGGLIQVGARRYRIVEDTEGRPRLRRESP